MPAKLSLAGRIFGNWKVISEGKPRLGSNGYFTRMWNCECKCGTPGLIQQGNLVSGHSTSCGCLMRLMVSKSRTTHGHTNSRAYRTWNQMRQRCNNPNNPKYADYGGRGITVCDSWNTAHGFESFLKEMGEGKKGWEIERIDNSRGYELWNCCWATRFRQAQNTRRNIVLTVRGITGCLAELCRHFNVPVSRVAWRLSVGKSLEQAFFSEVWSRD